jgi:hypothetical protein
VVEHKKKNDVLLVNHCLISHGKAHQGVANPKLGDTLQLSGNNFDRTSCRNIHKVDSEGGLVKDEVEQERGEIVNESRVVEEVAFCAL